MKNYTLIVLLICIGCANTKDRDPAVREVVKEDLYISPDTLHLFYGVLPGMCHDPAFLPTDTIEGQNYQLTCRYISEDTLVTRAYLDLSFTDPDAFKLALTTIRRHLKRFAQSYSASETFDTWLLPYKKRPLIEISLFQSANNQLSVEAHLKQSL